MTVGIYIRVSTTTQKQNFSLDYQKELGIDYCNRNKFKYEIFEEAKSGGSIEKRSEYKRLVESIKTGILDGIWVYDNDRLNRNIKDGYNLIELIKENKCRLFIGWEEKKIDSSGGRLEYNIKSVISDYERERISERMNFGKRELIKSGGKLGNIGLGFRRVGKRIGIDEEGANLVKEIFKIYNYKNVSSYGEVWKRVNSKRLKKGQKFKLSSSTIGRILKDKKYNGLYEGSVKIGDEIEEYKIELDKIIEDNLFIETQNKIKISKGLRRGNVKNDYELKGKVYCGDCGELMWVVKNYEYAYYSCPHKMKNLKEKRKNTKVRFDCKSKSTKSNKVSVKKLEQIIWDGLFEVLENSKDYHDEYKKRYSKDLKEKSRIKKILKTHEINKANKKRVLEEKIKKLYDKGLDDSIIDSLIEDYNKEISVLDKKIEILNIDKSKSEKLDEIKDYLDLMRIDLKNDYSISSSKIRKGIIQKYISSISIKRSLKDKSEYQIEINMNLKDVGKYKNMNLASNKDSISYVSKVKSMEVWRF